MEGIVSVIVTAVDILCLSPFYTSMRCLKCVHNAKVGYINLALYCGAWFIIA